MSDPPRTAKVVPTKNIASLYQEAILCEMMKGMKDRYHVWKAAIGVTRWIGSPVSLVVHTILFIASFAAVHYDFLGFEEMLLILTTIVSLEAIYLAIFIQMSINYTTQELEDVSEDIEEMQEDIGELQEDVEEITEEEDEEEAAERQRRAEQRKTLSDIQGDLRRLAQDITKLQKNPPPPPPFDRSSDN